METVKDGSRSLSLLDPSFAFVALCNLGLCSRHMGTMEATARLWHMHVFTKQAFFNSPRGRYVIAPGGGTS